MTILEKNLGVRDFKTTLYSKTVLLDYFYLYRCINQYVILFRSDRIELLKIQPQTL